MNRPEIVVEVIYPASLLRVWAALTDHRALGRWLLPNDFAPVLGQRFTLRAQTADEWPRDVHCQVVTLEAPCRLAFTWQDGSRRLPTRVSFTLESVPEGTRLRLEHSGFDHAVRDDARHRLHHQWGKLPLLLQLQVDATALIDEVLAFVREPRAMNRNALPVLAELQQSALGLPLDLLEAMVLDGVEQRAFVADFVTAVLDWPGVVDAGLRQE